YGGIAISQWDEIHQAEMLEEPQYGVFTFSKNTKRLIRLDELGEYYVRSEASQLPLYGVTPTNKKGKAPHVPSRNEYNLQKGGSSSTLYDYEGYTNSQFKRLNENDQTFEIHAWPLSHYQLARTQHFILKHYTEDVLRRLNYESLIVYPAEHPSYK